MSPESKRFYDFANFRVDIAEKVLLRDGEPVPLTPKAFDTLCVFTENAGRLLEKEELIQKIWRERFVEEGNLAFNIKVLRKALGDNVAAPQFIETVPRRGYRFIAEVTEVSESCPKPTAGNEKADSPASKPYGWLAIAGVCLVAVSLIAFFWLRAAPRNEQLRSMPHRLTDGGKVTIATVSPDGQYLVYAQKEGIGESLWLKEISTGSQTPLVAPQEAEFIGLTVSPDSQNVYYSVFANNLAVSSLARIALQSGGEPEKLANVPADVSVSFAPDGKRFAFTESYSSFKETYLKTADADGANQKTLFTAKGEKQALPIFRANPVAWSPDGALIVCPVQQADDGGTFYKILGFDPETGNAVDLSDKRWDFIESVAWKDAENLVLITGSENSPHQQIWQISRTTGETRQLTDDASGYQWISAARGKIYVVRKKPSAALQVTDFSNDLKTRQSKNIHSEAGDIDTVEWAANGKIYYNSWTSGKNEIWNINPDGTAPRQLTTDSNLTYGFTVSPADSRLVFSALEKGASSLFTADADGRNMRRLTDGINDSLPQFAPDGKSVVYQNASSKPTLWRASTEKDAPAPVQITGYQAGHPEISPDGSQIAYQFMDYSDGSRAWKIGLMNSADGRLLNKIEFPRLITVRKMIWRPNDQRLTMIFTKGETTGLLLLSALDGKSETIENFAQGNISSFAWSPDGTRLVFSQSHETEDVFALDVP